LVVSHVKDRGLSGPVQYQGSITETERSTKR